MVSKICNYCKEEKELHFFRTKKINKNGSDLRSSFCKKCESHIQIERVKKNGLKKTLEQKKLFTIYKKHWREKNKEEQNRKYRERCKNDISFKLRKNVSRAINHAIKKK
ncbi:hypothetical protein UFOVP1290_11 [uncultured Caudovirales phage]|uniref:Uncharacterized protein n=1 Tax=uncultured Caudovirales phage TaxID=2100421 RepID=A0A6J5RSF6_9CAUD|nr:hypothetical protein UFOVP1290_11 [uncultured Caudovirales phage]